MSADSEGGGGGGPPAAAAVSAAGEQGIQVASCHGFCGGGGGSRARGVRLRVSVRPEAHAAAGGGGVAGSLKGSEAEVGWGVRGTAGEAVARFLLDPRVAEGPRAGKGCASGFLGAAWSVAEGMLVADGARRMKVGRVVGMPWRGTVARGAWFRGRVTGEVALRPRVRLGVPESCDVPDPCEDGFRGVWRAYCDEDGEGDVGDAGKVRRAVGRMLFRDGVVGVAPRAEARVDLARGRRGKGVPLRAVLERALEDAGGGLGSTHTVEEVAEALDTRGDGMVHGEDWEAMAWPRGTWAAFVALGCEVDPRKGWSVGAPLVPRGVVEWQCHDRVGRARRGWARGWEVKGRASVPLRAVATGAHVGEGAMALCKRVAGGAVRVEVGGAATVHPRRGGGSGLVDVNVRRYTLVRAGWAFARLSEGAETGGGGVTVRLGLGNGGAFALGTLGT